MTRNMMDEIKGWAVLLPSGKFALDGGATIVPWVRRTKREAVEFAKGLKIHDIPGGKPVRVTVTMRIQ